MKSPAVRLLTLFFSMVLLTGCAIKQYSVTEQKSVCVDFTEKSVGYAVEVMAVPSQVDSVITLQIVKTHSHLLSDLQGNELKTYTNTANREAHG